VTFGSLTCARATLDPFPHLFDGAANLGQVRDWVYGSGLFATLSTGGG
jgi:hypothetical protein